MLKHQTGKHHQMQASQGRRKPLIIADQAPEARGSGERAFNDPSARQQDKATLGLRKFDHFQLDGVLLGRFRRHIARIGLIHKSQLDGLPGHVLDRLGQLADLRSILLVGGRHQQSQQVAQRIDGRMHFTAFAPLGSIIAGMAATFRRRLQGATIKDRR